jgi:hypothetical protein
MSFSKQVIGFILPYVSRTTNSESRLSRQTLVIIILYVDIILMTVYGHEYELFQRKRIQVGPKKIRCETSQNTQKIQITNIMAPTTVTTQANRSRLRRVKQNSSISGMFASDIGMNTSTPLPMSTEKEWPTSFNPQTTVTTTTESSYESSGNVIRMLLRAKRRLFLELAAPELVQNKVDAAPIRHQVEQMTILAIVVSRPVLPLPASSKSSSSSVVQKRSVSRTVARASDLDPVAYHISRAQAA